MLGNHAVNNQKLATGTKRARTLLTPVGALIFGCFTTLFVIASLAFDKWLGLPRIISTPISVYVATLILVAVTMIYAHPEERKCSRDFPNRANGIRGYGSIFGAVAMTLGSPSRTRIVGRFC